MKFRDDLRQRHLEAFETEFNARRGQDGEVRGVWSEAGLVLRAAVVAGWFLDVTDPDAVGDMKPAAAREWANKVNAAYVEAIRTDPN